MCGKTLKSVDKLQRWCSLKSIYAHLSGTLGDINQSDLHGLCFILMFHIPSNQANNCFSTTKKLLLKLFDTHMHLHNCIITRQKLFRNWLDLHFWWTWHSKHSLWHTHTKSCSWTGRPRTPAVGWALFLDLFPKGFTREEGVSWSRDMSCHLFWVKRLKLYFILLLTDKLYPWLYN